MKKQKQHTQNNFYTKLFAAWTPLRQPLFRAIWIAAFISNIGSLMQNTGSSYLITTYTSSTFLVSLLQASASFPLFLLGLPAGALADMVDRKKLLIIGQMWMFLAAALLGLFAVLHINTVWTLISLTFVLALGNALTLPAWMAMLSDLVAKKDLSKALTLSSLSYNLALVAGPAAAGIVLSSIGVGWIFILNALSFLAIIAVLIRWKRERVKTSLPKEELYTALRASIRYTRYTPKLQSLLIRAGIFIIFASAFWALIPAVARFSFHFSESGYGLLYVFMGLGSVIGAILLPKLQSRFTIDARIIGSTSFFALSLYMLAHPYSQYIAFVAMFIAGITWICLASTFNIFVQSVSPSWVRARAIGIYVVIFQAALAIGSMWWGYIATSAGISNTLLFAALGLIVGQIAVLKWPLRTATEAEITPSFHWTQPDVLPKIHPKRGPVLITISYTIDPKFENEFVKTITQIGRIRKRDGASYWAIYKDTGRYNHFLENFVVDSWGEHMHQHTRLTIADQIIEEKINLYLVGERPPITTHYIAKTS